MRQRDDQKEEAIYNATIQLLNEIGFTDMSVSKIAKRAGVSAATLYIYFENKEDMLLKTYLKVKRKMSERMLGGLDPELSVRSRLESVILNYIAFVLAHKDYFLFLEQMTNSPLPEKWCLDESSALFQPLDDLFGEGLEQKLFKQVGLRLLITYCMYPVTQLVKEHFKGGTQLDEEQMKIILQMSWDAVKA